MAARRKKRKKRRAKKPLSIKGALRSYVRSGKIPKGWKLTMRGLVKK